MAAKNNSTATKSAALADRARLAGMKSMTLADSLITVCECANQFDDAESLAEAVLSIARRQSQIAARIVDAANADNAMPKKEQDELDRAIRCA